MSRVMKLLNFSWILFALLGVLLASLPSTAQADGLILVGGTVHSQVGEPEIASVWIDEGKIKAVMTLVEAPRNVPRIDVTGLHVYPGFYDAFSRMGLVEVGAVAATVDTTELGDFNPHLSALTAVHPASEVIPVTRESGITHTLTAPASGRGGVIPGQASLIHLAGWTVEEMAIEPSAAMVINWPAIQTRSFDFSTFTIRETPFGEAEKAAKKAQDELRDWIDAARHHGQAEKSGSERLTPNAELHHLSRVLDQSLPVVIAANAKRDIEAAVDFAQEEQLRFVLVGGRDAWKVADLLAEQDVSVILSLPQSLPPNEDDPYDRAYRNAAVLAEAGVEFAFGSGAGGGFGPGGPHGSRTLPWEAATAVAYGLPAEEAIKALTLYPARMLGHGDLLGSIEAGKIANVVVFDGDPLEITTRVRHLIIGGQEVSTDNKHRQLYERYRAR